jgi:hypothetical protein
MAIAPIQTIAEPTPFSPAAAAADVPTPGRGQAPADRIRTIRVVARIVILLLAALRAWDARYDVSPDGISYLDLSDAVLQGHWSGLVSTYWSPLYPVLIGIARFALAWTPLGTPERELAIVHIVNLVLFAVSLGAFEWLVREIRETGAGWGNRALETVWGRVGAYALFGALTLAMSPPSLTTPDLLVNAACFAAFASILRLERQPSAGSACLVGASLGVGVLAKSFMLPFSLLVLGLVALRLRLRGARVLAIATGAWLILTAPWVTAMSHSTGHFTLGDTGRLAYIWFVDGVQPPNGADLPASALVDSARAIVPGLGVMKQANGANPLWLDPARWYPELHVRFDAARQLAVLQKGLQYYLTLFAPLLLAAAVLIALADGERLRLAWRRVWPILVACVAGLCAYALVYSIARYLVPFATAAALLVALAVGPAPPSARAALRAALAIAIVLTCEWLWGATRHFLVLPLAMAAALPTYVALAPRRAMTSVVAALTVALLVAVVADQSPASWYPFFIGAISVASWFAMRQAAAAAGAATAVRALRSAAIAASLCALVVRVARDTRGAIMGFGEPRAENPSWMIARDLGRIGVGPNARIAVIGSPYDAGWARLGRLRLVAAIPPARAAGYWSLDEAGRDVTSKLFADVGAVALVAVPAPDSLPAGWTRISGGAVLRLVSSTR